MIKFTHNCRPQARTQRSLHRVRRWAAAAAAYHAQAGEVLVPVAGLDRGLLGLLQCRDGGGSLLGRRRFSSLPLRRRAALRCAECRDGVRRQPPRRLLLAAGAAAQFPAGRALLQPAFLWRLCKIKIKTLLNFCRCLLSVY